MILTAIENQDHRKKLGKSGYQKGYPMFFTEFQIYLWALWHPEKKKKSEKNIINSTALILEKLNKWEN